MRVRYGYTVLRPANSSFAVGATRVAMSRRLVEWLLLAWVDVRFFLQIILIYAIAGAALAVALHGIARAQPINLVTAVDASDSITADEERLQLDGLALGVTSPEFLSRIPPEGVGFAVFAWSSGGDFQPLVPWTLLRGLADAAAVAATLRSAVLAPRSYTGPQFPSQSSDGARGPAFGMTDTGQAIGFGVTMLLTAPAPGARGIINVLTDSRSNAGAHPSMAREAAAGAGITINAVIFPDDPQEDLPAYFREHVLTGPGAFVLEAKEVADLPAILERKFLQDMIAALEGPHS